MSTNSERPRPTKAELNLAINKHLAAQAGRISFSQLRAIGLSPKAIRGRRTNGTLILESRPKPPSAKQSRWGRGQRPTPKRPHHLTERVYRAPGAPASPDGARWAAVLSAPGGRGRLDHVSACELHGLTDWRGGSVHVLSEGGGWVGPRDVKEHRTRSLPAEHRALVRGIPAVSVARGLLAAAEDVETTLLHDMLDTAVRIEKYDGQAMVELLDTRQMVPGWRPLTEAVAALDATSGTFRSIFERRTMRLIAKSSRIPLPVVNVILEGFLPDMRFVGTRAIIECDGRDYHRSPAQIIADDQRQEILEALGYRFLRLRWADVVYDEARTLARIERFVLDNLDAPVPVR